MPRQLLLLPLLFLLLLAACDRVPQPTLRVLTIDSPATGLSLRELPPQVLKSIGLPYGLAVVRAGGLAERAGLKVGDVVYGVNQKKVGSMEEFNRLLAAQQSGGRVGFLVRRGAADFYVAVDFVGPGEGIPKGAPPPRETLLRT